MRKPSPTPTLSVSDLSVTYGAHKALKKLTLEIKAGELVGVIGPNGAGKTTFIKALCGRVPSKGKISIQGKSIKRGQDRRRMIGLVPQDIGLYPQLTVKENLDVIARLMNVKYLKRRQGISQALESVKMTAKANVLVKDLSGGMKRRVNVAAAIMHDPAVIIFDEPTAGVDIPARDTVHRLARQLAEAGKSVILITHELEQAEALCDKILLLVDGEKHDFRPPSDLLSDSFGRDKHVRVRFALPPNAKVLSLMTPFSFAQGELPTIWQTVTQSDEAAFIARLTKALKQQEVDIREISVHRPGLNALMHKITSSQDSVVQDERSAMLSNHGAKL